MFIDDLGALSPSCKLQHCKQPTALWNSDLPVTNTARAEAARPAGRCPTGEASGKADCWRLQARALAKTLQLRWRVISSSSLYQIQSIAARPTRDLPPEGGPQAPSAPRDLPALIEAFPIDSLPWKAANPCSKRRPPCGSATVTSSAPIQERDGALWRKTWKITTACDPSHSRLLSAQILLEHGESHRRDAQGSPETLRGNSQTDPRTEGAEGKV
jgi:hypothetical protein